MKILGISAFYHDSAAAVTIDGKISAAAQEERFTRKKHDPSFPVNAVKFCLKQSGLNIDDLDAVAFYDKPWLKFERLMMTYYMYAPKGFKSFVEAVPVWTKEKMFLKKIIEEELTSIEQYDFSKFKLLFPSHHLSHAASAFYASPFASSAILTVDGVGEWATASIAFGEGKEITSLKELSFPHSLGLFYSAVTYYLGFRVNSGEYKVMGLAPYGNSGSEQTEQYKQKLKEHIIDIKNDGSCCLNQDFFDYSTGMKMTKNDKWQKLFGIKKREPEQDLTQQHCDFALACQQITEESVIKMAQTAKNLTKSENLCLAGGVALNCVANSKIMQTGIFKNIWIQPASGDAGGALGAALAAEYIYFGSERTAGGQTDIMKGSYLGPDFCKCEINKMIKTFKACAEYIDDEEMLLEKTAQAAADGKVIGWFQGKAEFGPRALGNRSIIADPRNEQMQMKMNLKIKHRESFRPFAPSVTDEDARNYFDIATESPYMLLTADVKKDICYNLPDGYNNFAVKDKLYFKRSAIPAVTHIDFSARVQTVSGKTNPRFYGLIKKFSRITGCPVLINTSFNVRGEPIVSSPEDAYRCFMNTEMDCLVIGNFFFEKEKQNGSTILKETAKQDFILD
ncbi:MAG: carbamoyltransferase [Endomicrobiaceae bacterium]|nr:carbamoyltransferase [Endomicrobiaceae bacterium]